MGPVHARIKERGGRGIRAGANYRRSADKRVWNRPTLPDVRAVGIKLDARIKPARLIRPLGPRVCTRRGGAGGALILSALLLPGSPLVFLPPTIPSFPANREIVYNFSIRASRAALRAGHSYAAACKLRELAAVRPGAGAAVFFQARARKVRAVKEARSSRSAMWKK